MRVIMIDDNGRQHDITAQVKNIVESTEMGQRQQAMPVNQPRPQGQFGRPAPSPFNRPMTHAPEMHRPHMGGQRIPALMPAPQGMPMQGRMPMGGQRIPAPTPMQGRVPMGGHRIPAPQGMPMGGYHIPTPQSGFGRPQGMPIPQGMPMGGQQFGDDQMIPVAIDPMTGQPVDFNQQMPEPSASPAGSPYYRPYWQQDDQQGEFAGQQY